MNRKGCLVVLSVLCGLAVLPDFGQAGRAVAQPAEGEVKPSVPRLVSRVVGALARLEYSIDDKIVQPQKRFGQCVCINALSGIFMTRDVPGSVPAGELKDFVLITPGAGGKRIKAELMGTDPETGLTFIRAVEGHKWSEVRFPNKSGLQRGQRVISVGLLDPRVGNVPYIGTGMVSAVVRLPHQLVYVSGGDLTVSSSPVLTDDGRVVGMVWGQIPMEYRMLLAGRWTDVGLAGRQTTRFFMPVEEFAHALAAPGTVRPLPWMGVVKYHPVLPEQEDVKGLGRAPAVLVGQIIPDTPAAKAGIKQGDAIVAIEDKPLERMATPGITVAEFKRRLIHYKPGRQISLTLLRKGRRLTVQVVLEAMPARPHQAARHYDKRLGMIARDLVLMDRHVGRDKPLLEKGVAVVVIRRGSPAARGKLRPGDLITAVNNKPVPSVAVLRSVLEGLAKAGDKKPINFIVQRGDKPEALLITPE